MAAQREVDQAMRELAHDFPETNKGAMHRLRCCHSGRHPADPQRLLVNALAILQSVLLLLLLAVCGNTANLRLARASA